MTDADAGRGPGRRSLPIIAVALAMGMGAPARVDADPYSAFTYCAPPYRPACVDRPGAAAACEAELQLFIATVFKYRECLEHETERAVREANEAIQAHRCKMDKSKCFR